MKRKNRFMLLILIFFLAGTFIFSPICSALRSYMIMFPYSYIHQRKSVLQKNQILFRIPGGLNTKKSDWYPFVITFNADEGLSAYLGEAVEFTVLYNFGQFQIEKATSSYYHSNSPYYSSFYGGYIVKPAIRNRKFGFKKDGTIHIEELVKVPEYDQIHLVLSSLGCPIEQRIFKENVTAIQSNVEYANYEDWVRLDSEIKTNSPAHEYRSFQQGYLQYGRPIGRTHYGEDFPVIDLKGRVYARYFEELQATFVLYAMAPSWEIIEEIDKEFLSEAEIGCVHNN